MRQKFCYIIIPTQFDENGYIPSAVFAGESGHRPMTGDPAKMQLPWYWGKTLEEAEATCARQNAQLGLTEREVEAIILSSMAD